MRTSFLCPWHLAYQFVTIFNKMEIREELANKNFHFYCSKKGQFLFESFSRISILLEIVQNWYTKCRGHKKRCPHFSSFRVRPCPAHTACIYGIFSPFKAEDVKTFWRQCMYLKKGNFLPKFHISRMCS